MNRFPPQKLSKVELAFLVGVMRMSVVHSVLGQEYIVHSKLAVNILVYSESSNKYLDADSAKLAALRRKLPPPVDPRYPYPFSPPTPLRFMIPRDDSVSLRLSTRSGSEVNELFKGFLEKGQYSVWLLDEELPRDKYLLRLNLSDTTFTRELYIGRQEK